MRETFIRLLVVQSEGLPDEECVLQDLEELRHELSNIIAQIEQSDEEGLAEHKRKLDARLDAIMVSASRSQHRAKDAVATARALITKTIAYEHERRRESRQALRHLAKNPDSGILPETIRRLRKESKRFYKQVIKDANLISRRVRRATRVSRRATREVVRGTRRRKSVRWILRRGSYICWSLVFLVIIFDYILNYTEHRAQKLLQHLIHIFQLSIPEKEKWLELPKLALLVVVWFIDISLRPWLERWQANYERSGLKLYAVDVLNAAFTTRAYRVFVEASYLAIRRELDDVGRKKSVDWSSNMRPIVPRVPFLVFDSAPSIDSLSEMKPLPEIGREIAKETAIRDYVIGILRGGNSRVPEDKKEKWYALYAQDTEQYIALNPDRLVEVFNEFGIILGDRDRSLIEDYRYYLQTGTRRHTDPGTIANFRESAN